MEHQPLHSYFTLRMRKAGRQNVRRPLGEICSWTNHCFLDVRVFLTAMACEHSITMIVVLMTVPKRWWAHLNSIAEDFWVMSVAVTLGDGCG